MQDSNRTAIALPEGCHRERIRTLNDQFRRTLTGGKILITAGVMALGSTAVEELLTKVTTFDQFTDDNDPHGERDFGAVEHEGHRVFWKIDYYDLTLRNGSQNPSDPILTARVITIMLSEEY